MKAAELIAKLEETLTKPTYYVMGGFGARLGKDYVNYSYKYNREHREAIEQHYNTDPLTFAFDCVCLVKAVLFWGFSGDQAQENGGSKYNGDEDITISAFKKSCAEISKDFTEGATAPGELVFIGTSHIGVHIGNGEVIECTPAWAGCVQKTLLPWRNSTNYDALPVRAWDCHGKCSFVDYTADPAKELEEKLAKAQQAAETAEKARILAENARKDAEAKLLAAEKNAQQWQASAEKTQAAAEEANERAAAEKADRMEAEAKLAEKEREAQGLTADLWTALEEAQTQKDAAKAYKKELDDALAELGKVHLRGDINGDGKVDMADVFALLLEVIKGGQKR